MLDNNYDSKLNSSGISYQRSTRNGHILNVSP